MWNKREPAWRLPVMNTFRNQAQQVQAVALAKHFWSSFAWGSLQKDVERLHVEQERTYMKTACDEHFPQSSSTGPSCGFDETLLVFFRLRQSTERCRKTTCGARENLHEDCPWWTLSAIKLNRSKLWLWRNTSGLLSPEAVYRKI